MNLVFRFPMLFLWVFVMFSQGQAQNDRHFALQTHSKMQASALIDTLEQLFDLSFAYPAHVFNRMTIDPVLVSHRELGAFLDDLFSGTDIKYRIRPDDRVLLRVHEELRSPFEGNLLLRGIVVDEYGEMIPWVEISFVSGSAGISADERGAYSWQLKKSSIREDVIFHRLGYLDKQLTFDQAFHSDTVTMHSIELALMEVTIVDRLPLLRTTEENMTAFSISEESHAMSMQLGMKDFQRMVQYLPGVSADDDLSSDIQIRGSLADETLLMVDGIPIYRSDHFYGIFGSVNSLYINEVHLYKNALPTEYGGKTGGMLEMVSNTGFKPLQLTADLSNLAYSLFGSFPISNKLSLMVAGRSSFRDVANSKLFDWVGTEAPDLSANGSQDERSPLITSSPDFSFYDLNAKAEYKPSQDHSISMNFYQSKDDYLEDYMTSFKNNGQNGPVRNEESYLKDEEWSTLGVGFQYQWEVQENFTLFGKAFYTDYVIDGLTNTSLERMTMSMPQLVSFSNHQNNSITDASIQLGSKYIHKSHTLRAGLEFLRHNVDIRLESDDQLLLGSAEDASEMSVYLDDEIQIGDRFRIQLGSRFTYYQPTGQLYPSPRVHAGFQASDNLSFKSSLGLQYQFVRELEHENRMGQLFEYFVLADGDNYPVGKSLQLMAGMKYRLSDWTLDVEFFHKDMDGVLEHAALKPGFQSGDVIPASELNFSVFQGKGKAVGMDLLLSFQSKSYTGWVAYTLSKTTHRFANIYQNQAFPAQNDRRHQLKFINMVSLGKFDLSGTFVYSSGKPYTDLRNLMGGQDRRLIVPRDRISYLPAYQRADAGISYRFEIGKMSVSANLSVFNVFNRNNVKYLQYVYSVPQFNSPNEVIGSETALLDRTLSLGMTLKF